MKNILLISDTHGYMGPEIIKHAEECDEVWHAGDWGHISTSEIISEKHLVRGVYGNIDGIEIRKSYPEELFFEVEQVKVYITHIGGYPGRYQKGIREKLISMKPDLFICGHSHICKVTKDKNLNLFHFNPGAIGNKGFHKKRTMMRFSLNCGNIFDVKVLEYERNYE
ncbi:MAG: metallophosphoesterase family protein [Bacteroidia bacterium]|nr:metallophosphoesterase family protein [Bacteroidia bacterium]